VWGYHSGVAEVSGPLGCDCRWVSVSPTFARHVEALSSMLRQSKKNSYFVWTAWPWRLRRCSPSKRRGTAYPTTHKTWIDLSDSETFRNNFQVFLLVYEFFAGNGIEWICERSCPLTYPPACHNYKFNQWTLLIFCADDWDQMLSRHRHSDQIG